MQTKFRAQDDKQSTETELRPQHIRTKPGSQSQGPNPTKGYELSTARGFARDVQLLERGEPPGGFNPAVTEIVGNTSAGASSGLYAGCSKSTGQKQWDALASDPGVESVSTAQAHSSAFPGGQQKPKQNNKPASS